MVGATATVREGTEVRTMVDSAESSDRGGAGIAVQTDEQLDTPSDMSPQWRGGPRPRWRGEIEIRGRSILAQMVFPVYLMRTGDRYHDHAECSSLNRSTLTRSPWCRECLAEVQRWGASSRPIIWSRGYGQMVQLDERCDVDLRRYEFCSICRRGGR